MRTRLKKSNIILALTNKNVSQCNDILLYCRVLFSVESLTSGVIKSNLKPSAALLQIDSLSDEATWSCHAYLTYMFLTLHHLFNFIRL